MADESRHMGQAKIKPPFNGRRTIPKRKSSTSACKPAIQGAIQGHQSHHPTEFCSSIMDYPRSTGKETQIIEAKLSDMRPGIRAYIVVRIVRLWKTVLPPYNKFISTDFLAVDDKENAMHGMIPAEYSDEFNDRLVEGSIYKIRMFQVTSRKTSHNSIPNDHILYFNSTTEVEEIVDHSDNYPEYHFRFATIQDIESRTERNYFLTDVIGIFMSVAPMTNVQISPIKNCGSSNLQIAPQQYMVNKRDIFIKLLGGEQVRISIWQDLFLQLNIDELLKQPTKPIIIVAGTTIKTHMRQKYLSTSSATKIYINLHIPETKQLREMFIQEISPVEVLLNDELTMTGEMNNAQNATIEDLHYLNAKDIKGRKFRILAKISKINMRKGWYYKACSICTYRADDGEDSFTCAQHGPITPRLIMRLNLILEDETGKLEAVIFGGIAEKLATFQLTTSVISGGVQNDKLPEIIDAIINNQYHFVVGLTDQASQQLLLKYKIFAFQLNKQADFSDAKNKGKTMSASHTINQDPSDEQSPAKKMKHSDSRKELKD